MEAIGGPTPVRYGRRRSLSVEDFKRRLESVLEGGDRASIFSYLLAGQGRRQVILERRRERAASRAETPAAATDTYVSGTPFDATLDAMQKALGGEQREAELEAARAIGAEAFEVEATAHSLRHEGRSFAEVHAMQRYAMPGPVPEAARGSRPGRWSGWPRSRRRSRRRIVVGVQGTWR